MAGARIVAAGWAYAYPGSADPVVADVSVRIDPGELVILMGASGSGKSTLLAALSGTLPEGGGVGRLEVAGAAAAGAGLGRVGAGEAGAGVAGAGVARLGLVQQEPEANIVMQRVGDDVAFPLENAAVPADRIWARVGAALAEVGLDVGWDRSTAQLSGGQQQLLAVAGAAAADPALLLLDEPTANLDPSAAAAVLAAVAAVRADAGATVLVVEHRVEPWLAQADRVLLVEDGAVRDLTPDGLRAYLTACPESAARVWLGHEDVLARRPVRPSGREVLVAADVVLAGRLAATSVVAHAGEVVALTGPPGSGKSTLLAVLAGLLEPSAGSVCLPADSGPSRCDPWRWPAAEVAATFGVVFQNPEHQFVTGRVIDEVHHGLAGAGICEPTATTRAHDMLARLHLTELALRNPFTLSGGEQRRLSVGTALALDPGILLLDEPTFGQDPTTWAQVVGIIADHRDAGGTAVLATHDPALVRALGAREVRLGASAPHAPRPAPASNAPTRPVQAPAESGSSTSVSPAAARPRPASPGTPSPGPAPSTQAPSPTSASPTLRPLPTSASPTSASPTSASPTSASPTSVPSALRGTPPASPAPPQAPPAGPRTEAGLSRLDPLALVGGAMLLSVAGLISGSVALNLALAASALLVAVLGGLPRRRVALLAGPVLLATASVALSNALLSQAGIISAAAWSAAALPASRVLAVALPGLVAAVAVDPTGLADALVVRLRVPARGAYSVLAGLRLLPLLGQEWAVLGRASRARGLAGRGVRARTRQFASMTFRLLVAALRRGGRLAVALDARGLGAGPRTVARPVRWRWLDTVAIAVATGLVCVAALVGRAGIIGG